MTSACRGCGRDVLWAKTARGRALPLDPEPHPTGNVDLVWVGGERMAVVLGKQDSLAAQASGHKLFLSHWATCPKAYAFRR